MASASFSGHGRGHPRIIRVLIHCYGEADHEPQHVYLGEAAALRLDISGAQ